MPGRLPILLASLLPALPAFAALPSSESDNPPVQIIRDIEYARPNGHPLRLDLYVPRHSSGSVPVVMWIHGGGWRTGNKDIPMMLPLASLGVAVASIDYRLSQDAIWPAQIYDCKAAVRWLRQNGANQGFDPARIGVAGASAGGHLAALLGTTADHPDLEGNEGSPGVSSRVQAVCDFFGPTDFTSLGADYSKSTDNLVADLLGGSIDSKFAQARAASPVFYVTKDSAPFFIAHGSADPIVPLAQSEELNAALKKAGVESTLYVVQGGGHGFNDPVAFADAVDFLLHHLGAR